MCGFAGYVPAPGGPPPDRATLQAMAAAIAHRGPDGEGFHFAADCGLAFRRLAIIDLETGDQPLTNEDERLWLTLNGELYNYRELRAELGSVDHTWRTSGDAEVVLHGYEQWGLDRLLERLNGMFGFALFDGAEQRLHLVRDRLGIKPLYWLDTPEGLYFASEIQALERLPGVDLHLDPDGLRHFLRQSYIPAPWSIYREIRQLEPGTILTYAQGRLSTRRYWRPPAPTLQPLDQGMDRLAAELGELLTDSVRLRLRSDVPVGLFLSGGLDSGALATSLPADSGLPAFTIDFPQGGHSEAGAAAEVARACGLVHHVRQVPAPGALLTRTVATAYGEPFADSSAVNLFQVCGAAREQVTVALSGDGGDELLGGYPTYTATRLARVFGRLPAPLRASLSGGLQRFAPPDGAKVGWRIKANRFVRYASSDPVASHFAWRRMLDPRGLSDILAPSQRDPSFEERHLSWLRSHIPEGEGPLDPLNLLMYLDLLLYLPHDMLTKVDRASMAHGLEVRVPFLDHRLVEWSLQLPARAKLTLRETKRPLRHLLAGRFPERVRRLPKAGFNAPIHDWLKGAPGDLLADLLTDLAVPASALIDVDIAQWLLARHRAGQESAPYRLWTILILLLWLERSPVVL